MSTCIWYVSKYVFTPDKGEPAGRPYGIMREFARFGHRAVVITSDSMGKFGGPPVSGRQSVDEQDGITICRLRTFKYQNSRSMRRVLSWLDFERKLWRADLGRIPRPDVIIVSSLSLLTILNGLRMRRKFNCRLVFEIRDIWPLTLTEQGGFRRLNPLVALLGAVERMGYRRADLIVGTMPNLESHVREVTGQQLRVACIPMGFDPDASETFERLPEDYVAHHFPKSKFLVAYAGSIGFNNALDVLFKCAQAMRTDPVVHFMVLGDGDLRESYVERYGHLPNVTFAPRVPKSQVHDFLQRCDLLYLSTHNSKVWEYGQSLNKLIDYMQSEKPIVASYSGYPSMIDEASCGTFLPAGDAASLVDEISRFMSMPPEERRAMGARGRSWLIEHRSFSALAFAYLQLLMPD